VDDSALPAYPDLPGVGQGAVFLAVLRDGRHGSARILGVVLESSTDHAKTYRNNVEIDQNDTERIYRERGGSPRKHWGYGGLAVLHCTHDGSGICFQAVNKINGLWRRESASSKYLAPTLK
jgi:hypothetical protein